MAPGKKTRQASGDSTDSSEVDPGDYIPTPPDGGWGWVIVLSSFMCNMIVDGICYSLGVLLPKWVEVFHETREAVSLVGALLYGMLLCIGPIVSGLTNKFGCRIVTVAGSIFAMLAFLAASFSTNITVLILTYGFLGGFGFGLIYLPSNVIMGYYFEKKRAIATGIALCGSGVGTFIFAPVSSMMLNTFDWRNLVMVQAGVVLNVCVFGMLMRPLEPTKKMKQPIRKEEIENARKKAIGHRKCNTHSTSSMIGTGDSTNLKEIKKIQDKQEEDPKTASFKNTSCFLKDFKEIHHTTVNGYAKTEKEPFSSLTPLRGESLHHVTNSDYSRPMYRQDIFYSGSITNIPEYKSSQSDMKQYIASITTIPDMSASSCWDKCTCLPLSVVDILKDMLDISLLTDISVLMLFAGNLLAMSGFYIPYTYVVDHALQLGISKPDAAFLLSIIDLTTGNPVYFVTTTAHGGCDRSAEDAYSSVAPDPAFAFVGGITNTVGRIASGLLVDILKLDALLINNIALVLSAVLLFVEPFCESYELLVGFSLLYGLCIAAYMSLTSIIICNLLGLRKLTNALGLVILARGVAGLIGPPAAGAAYTATGSYDYSFWLGGVMFALGAGCHLILHLPCVKRKAKGKEVREIVISEEEDRSMIKECEESL